MMSSMNLTVYLYYLPDGQLLSFGCISVIQKRTKDHSRPVLPGMVIASHVVIGHLKCANSSVDVLRM